MVQLYADILLLIMLELQDDFSSLYYCALVNRSWSQIAVPLLWKYISCTRITDGESRVKLYKVIANFLPIESENLLIKNNIILPSYKLPRKPTFEYMNYFTQITSFWIRDMVEIFIEEDSVYKKTIFEDEIYNLVFKNCKNIKHFQLNTDKEFYKFPSAGSFFLNLQSFAISFKNNIVTSKTLLELANICQNIKTLEVNYCNEDSKGLATFIEMQHDLRSLFLHFNDIENKYPLLSNVIKKKAATLKKFMVIPHIDPDSLSSLINLQYLEIFNHNVDEPYTPYKTYVDWEQWNDCLDKTSFPNLQYFEATYLPSSTECLIIEKSGETILEIDICCSLESLELFQHYQVENLFLINIISKYCPNLRRLNMDIDFGNFGEINRIFSNCPNLEKLSFSTNIPTHSDVGDYLLEIISKESPLSLREFAGDDWNFSKDGLEAFFESWKNKKRNPIKFIHQDMNLWPDDHKNVMLKYMKEGVIILENFIFPLI